MNLLIVDDHEIVRKGIRAVLEGEEQVAKIEEAGELEEALKLVTIHEPPDLILIDVNLGGKNGLDLIEMCKDRQIDTKFVVLTSSSRKGDFIRAKELGVAGYILKSSNVEDILYAIKAVNRGRKFYDTQITMEEATSERSKPYRKRDGNLSRNRKGAYEYANSREIVYYREYSEKAYYKSP